MKSKLQTQNKNSSFSILHLNIRSLNKNFEDFKFFLFNYLTNSATAVLS